MNHEGMSWLRNIWMHLIELLPVSFQHTCLLLFLFITTTSLCFSLLIILLFACIYEDTVWKTFHFPHKFKALVMKAVISCLGFSQVGWCAGESSPLSRTTTSTPSSLCPLLRPGSMEVGNPRTHLLSRRLPSLFHILLSCFHSDTDYLRYLFPQFVKSNLFHLCYTAIGQRISICNYWNGNHEILWPLFSRLMQWDTGQRLWDMLNFINKCCDMLFTPSSAVPPDPHHRDMYVNTSDYLALLNSERPNPNSTGQQFPCGQNSSNSQINIYATEIRQTVIQA